MNELQGNKINHIKTKSNLTIRFLTFILESFRHWMPIVSNEETVLSSTDLIVDIVCYGLGSLSSSMKSQYQMALVLILRSLLQVNLQKQPTKI
jgi:hypothetical protein